MAMAKPTKILSSVPFLVAALLLVSPVRVKTAQVLRYDASALVAKLNAMKLRVTKHFLGPHLSPISPLVCGALLARLLSHTVPYTPGY